MLTAGDPGVVARHREAMLRIIHGQGVDLLFTNEAEAQALIGASPARPSAASNPEQPQTPAELAAEAGRAAALTLAESVPLVVVTCGSSGSFVAALGRLHQIPAYWLPQGPVDTCGAGDAFMSGFLYAQLVSWLRGCCSAAPALQLDARTPWPRSALGQPPPPAILVHLGSLTRLQSLQAGYDVKTAGEFASRTASAVISRFGPHLHEEDAEDLVSALPEHTSPFVRVQLGPGLALGAGGFGDF